MRRTIEQIKSVGGHYMLLETAVLISFFGLALNPGSLGDLMRIGGAIFLFNLIIGNYKLKQLTTGHLFFLIIFVTILIISYFMQTADMAHRRSLRYYQALPWMVLAIHCLYARRKDATAKLPQQVYSASILVLVVIHFIVFQFLETEEAWGIYGIKHHLGYFASLTIPILWYFLVGSNGWIRILIYAGLFIDIYLLFESGSRIAWLAFGCGILGTAFLFFKARHVLVGIGIFVIIACLAAAFSGFSAIEQNIFDFATHWRTDERVALWADTVRMLSENSVSEWIFGHGIGSFRYYFKLFSSNSAASTSIYHLFPHNVVLQLIFENGLIGSFLVITGLAYLIISLWRGHHKLKDKKDHNLLIITFALLWINLIYCGLTQNFYSKFSMYPLSMICGMAFVLLDKTAQTKPLQSWKFFQRHHKPNLSISKS